MIGPHCLTEDTVAALLDGQLVSSALHAARAHIAQCSDCRALWTAAAQAQPSLVAPALASTGEPLSGGALLPTTVLPRGTTVGRYIILQVVGAGGMSVVYSAYDPELGRKVALKFLRLHRQGAASDPQTQTLPRRLQREAQAMARLSHPCVITVHDIGVYQGDLFIAMEFVEGGTLWDWCTQKPRALPEIVALFRRLGQGLAAAHRVGIVHRDFKPANVLISHQGDVRITDFGLARLLGEADEPLGGAAERPAQQPETASHSGSALITQAGAVLGTPAYMAPEQLAAQPVDARADQFSFCVTLYEALCGVRPPAADPNDRSGEATLPGSDKLPAFLRQVLQRGLRRDPAARYPNMEALGTALAVDPQKTRRRTLYGLAAAIVLVAATVGGYQAHRAPALTCRGAERKLVGIWDAGRQQTIHAAFLRTGRPFAHDAWRAIEQSLNEYARSFVRLHTEACEATRLRAEQSEQLMDRRMICLEQRRQELAAVTELFATAEAPVVEAAQRITAALPGLDACAQTQELLLTAPPPRDPAVRARVSEYAAQLARIHVLHSAGQYASGLQLLNANLPAVRELDQRSLRAEYLHTLGLLQESTSSYRDAEVSYEEALLDAEAGHQDLLAAQAWVNILVLYNSWKPKDPHTQQLRKHAAAAIARVGDPPALLASYYVAEARAQSDRGEPARALESLQQALTAYERARGPQHVDVARTLTNLGTVYRLLGRLRESERCHQRALAIGDRLFGAQHPFTATIRLNLGNTLNQMDKTAEALVNLQHALQVFTASYTKPDMHTSSALISVGNALMALGRYRESEDHFTRALQMAEELLGKDHPSTCVEHRNLGELLTKQRLYAQALLHFEAARRIAIKAYGPVHPEVGGSELGIAHVHLEQGKAAQAVEEYRHAEALYAQLQKEPDQDATEAMIGTGESLLALGRWNEALLQLKRALTTLSKEEVPVNVKLRAKISALIVQAQSRAGLAGPR